jgi:hypothetical protein
VPIRTRILHRSTSLLGFVLETPCQTINNNRYLVLYDNFTASYHSHSEFHLCLCQDYRRHLLNIDYKELRSHYQHAFQNLNNSLQQKYSLGSIIRVRKFGTQYHHARIIDKDCSIIKICFFERKSQPEMWIYSNSSIIDSYQDLSLSRILRISSSLSSSSHNSMEDMIISDTDLSRLRKRKTSVNNINEGISIVND